MEGLGVRMAEVGLVFVFVGCRRGFPPLASVLEPGVAGPWGNGEQPLGAILRSLVLCLSVFA